MKRRAVEKTRRAKTDALHIYLYIGENNFDAAERFLVALNAEFDLLSRMPGAGTQCDFRHPKLNGLRSLPVTSF